MYRRTITGLAFKGEATPRGAAATWVVSESVERAIGILEQLQADDAKYLFTTLAGDIGYRGPNGSMKTASHQHKPEYVRRLDQRLLRRTQSPRRNPTGSPTALEVEHQPVPSNTGLVHRPPTRWSHSAPAARPCASTPRGCDGGVASARELAVEAEGNVVRHLGPRNLVEGLRVEDEQRGRAACGVEDDRQEHAVVLAFGVRAGDEDRLARVAAALRPVRRGLRLDVDAHDAVDPARFRVDAPNEAMAPPVAAAIVDARQVKPAVCERPARDAPVAEGQAKAPQVRTRGRLTRAQPLQVEVLDDLRIGVGAEVDDDVVAIVVGVDVVKGEAGVGLEARRALAGGAIEEREARSPLGLPAVVLDVRDGRTGPGAGG